MRIVPIFMITVAVICHLSPSISRQSSRRHAEITSRKQTSIH